MGHGIDHPNNAGALHPVADLRYGLPAEKQAVVPVTERPESNGYFFCVYHRKLIGKLCPNVEN
jgi:hypothetical protein